METEASNQQVRNLAELSRPMVEVDVEYILFIENEKIFSRDDYDKLKPVVQQLVDLIIATADNVVERTEREVIYKVAGHLREEVANVVYRARTPAIETVTSPEHKEVDDGLYSW